MVSIAIAKKESTRWTTLSYTSSHKELSSVSSREFHVRDTVNKKPGNSLFSSTEKIQE